MNCCIPVRWTDVQILTLVNACEWFQDENAGWTIDELHVRVAETPNSFAGEYPKAEQVYNATVKHTFQDTSSISYVEKEYVLTRHESVPERNQTFRLPSAKRARKPVRSPVKPSTGQWTLSITTLRHEDVRAMRLAAVRLLWCDKLHCWSIFSVEN